MASLRRHPRSPYWIACFTLSDGTRTTRTTGTTNKKQALHIALQYEQAEKEAGEGRLTEVKARKVIAEIFARANNEELPSSSIKGYLDAWLKRKELEAGATTHLRYTTAIKHALEFLGHKADRDLSHLRAKELNGLRDALAEKLSVNSANYTLKVIRAALNQAHRDRLVDTNEASRVSLIRRGTTVDRRPFQMEELQKILAVADDEWRGIILMGLYTGLRLGDIAHLTWANVDLAQREIAVTTEKTGRRQVLPLHPQLLQFLERLPSSDTLSAPLFPRAYETKDRNSNVAGLSNQFYEILVAAGMAPKRTHKSRGIGRGGARRFNPVSFHSLRHTATSLLKNAGVSDSVTRDIIGHDSPAVSANYTHIDMIAKREALNKLPSL